MKKLPIVASIALLGTLSVVGFCKPIYEVRAEEPNSEPQTSEVVSSSQESAVSSQEEKKWEDVQNVKVEGKTIKEWIEGIKNEETRRSTILALAVACGGVVLIGLKWLKEHKLLSATKKINEANEASIEYIKKVSEEFQRVAKEFNEKAIEANQQLKDTISHDQEERKAIHMVLLEMAKSDEKMIANETFKRIRQYVEVNENGETE